ncbi:hypothetical protein TrVFT333_002030 [Trichoderma virens FT-333]|nr:hypothetical protein TrVFT333_002030 [Trichoderma virens FT-333]
MIKRNGPDENTKSELSGFRLVMMGIRKLDANAEPADENTKNRVNQVKVASGISRMRVNLLDEDTNSELTRPKSVMVRPKWYLMLEILRDENTKTEADMVELVIILILNSIRNIQDESKSPR